jgi:hypothetical protein
LLVHKVCWFYKEIYLIGSKISKRDRFGIYLKTENICLELIELIITASFENKNNKLSPLKLARIKTENLKRFIRLMHELDIINNQKYIHFESELQEISKMLNGWIKYSINN